MKNLYQTALYAGTFDPVTNGHLWVINESVKIFEQVIVAITVNPAKKTVFSVEERMSMIRQCVPSSVKVTFFEAAYTVRYAKTVNAGTLIRGIRNHNDYEYEQTLNQINCDLEPSVHTMFLMPPPVLAHVSSSLVRGMVGPRGWQETVQKYVPFPVYEHLLLKYPS